VSPSNGGGTSLGNDGGPIQSDRRRWRRQEQDQVLKVVNNSTPAVVRDATTPKTTMPVCEIDNETTTIRRKNAEEDQVGKRCEESRPTRKKSAMTDVRCSPRKCTVTWMIWERKKNES
jgi:hypothetical protein